MENSKKYGEIGEMAGRPWGAGKWRIRRNLEKSEKWAGRPPWGSGSGEFEEIWRNRRNGLVDHGGSGSGEFEEILRNRRNGLADHYGGQEMENSKKYGEIGTIE